MAIGLGYFNLILSTRTGRVTEKPIMPAGTPGPVPQKDNSKRNRLILIIMAVFIVVLFLVSGLAGLGSR